MTNGETRATIYTPLGRDAAVVAKMLADAGIPAHVCEDARAFERSLNENATFAVVTEEAMRSADLNAIDQKLAAQPAWADLPFIVFTQRGGGPERNPGAKRLSDLLSNVTFLERPFHPTTFISVARTALRSRTRQFEARAHIEELDESERRLRTALNAGRLGAWELELSNKKLTTSATCKAVFGRTVEQSLTYEELVASIHPDDRVGMQEAVRATIETGRDYAVEYRTIWPDRSIHWAEIRARLVRGRGKTASRLVGVSADITNRKKQQEDARVANEILEKRVVERTAELTAAHEKVLTEIAQREQIEDRLRQAQKMETVGQLTGGVAHDFNNLLMAVIANLDLLGKHLSGDTKAMRLIEGAMQGAKRGAALTQRLLAFARQQDLRVVPTDLVALVDGISDLIERSIGSEIELVKNLPPSARALIDPNQVELAILNLVVNARDAMPNGGQIIIDIDPAAKPPAGSGLPHGSYTCISITDTGSGMSAEVMARATEPFFSTKELGKGTGLGLSMIDGLSVQLNGRLILSSEVGVGTRAEIWLPATEQVAIGRPESSAAPVFDAKTKLTILVVDDDALIAMSTVDMLEDLGHEVIEANTGDSALAILNENPTIDLLITDYSMPKMNGAQLARAARELRGQLPILLATGYAEMPPGAGIDLPRIGKPYQQAQLAAEINKLVGG